MSKTMENLARRYMEVSGAKIGLDVYIDEFVNKFKDIPEITDEQMTTIREKMQEIIELAIPVFAESYSYDELKTAIEYCESPLGKSMIKKGPEVQKKMVQIGQEQAMKLIEEFDKF